MFDPKKAAFWLIAAVVGVQLLVVVIGVVACIYAGVNGMDTGSCGKGQFGEILASCLAVGLALYGANRNG